MKKLGKAIAAAAALLLIAGGFAALRDFSEKTSYAEAGRLVKERFPEYDALQNEELGRRLFGKGYVEDRQKAALVERGFADSDIEAYLIPKSMFSPQQQILMLAGYAIFAVLFAILLKLFISRRRDAAERITDDANEGEPAEEA